MGLVLAIIKVAYDCPFFSKIKILQVKVKHYLLNDKLLRWISICFKKNCIAFLKYRCFC